MPITRSSSSTRRPRALGGNVPLGSDLPAAGIRTLQVNEPEAATVRDIFSRYIEIGSVHAVQRGLGEQGIVSKLRTYSTGRTSGGGQFSRGALFHLLRNRIYLSQIVHKNRVFDGEHDGIVEPDLFDACSASSMAMLGAITLLPTPASPRRPLPASCSMQTARR